MSLPLEIREATPDDADAIEAIAAESWPDREGLEYLADAFPSWLDRENARTAVAEVAEEPPSRAADPDGVPADAPAVAGIVQITMLTEDEAWAQGMRVHPAYRGEGVGSAIVEDCFDWARQRGATVVRNMVFSWNGAGLGQSRATGFEPATELRFASPDPTADADPSDHGPTDAEAVADPAAVWRYWTHSDAREHLDGLAADDEESWAVRELTRADLDRAADADDGAIAIGTRDGVVGVAVRSRIDHRSPDDGDCGDDPDPEEPETVAVYGATAWDDLEACAAVISAIAADAAAVGADDTKVLLPETVRHVSDAAACRVEIDDEPDFVLAADLATNG